MNRRSLVVVGLAVALVVAVVAPVTALTGLDTDDETEPSDTDETTASVGVGQQIATVVTAESEHIQSDVEQTALAASFERAAESRRAELLAEQATQLRAEADELQADYQEATQLYREGELSESIYARRIAVLNVRASSLADRIEAVRERAANLSALDLRAAGLNRTALRQIDDQLDAVSGTGPQALLERFTGERTGSVTVETTATSVSISVDSDGRRSREVERQRDDDDDLTVSQSVALSTARTVLSDVEGEWTLTGASVDGDDGAYRFRFALEAPNTTGEASVAVDGSTGEVFGLEEEIRPDGVGTGNDAEDDSADPRDRESDDGNATDDDGELILVLVDGRPGPGNTVTVAALVGREPAANVTMSLNGERVGETGEGGLLTVQLPDSEATLTAERGERTASLEFGYEGSDPVRQALSVDVAVGAAGMVVTVEYEGLAVSNATILVDGDRVGRTDADGWVTTSAAAVRDGEVGVTVLKGAFEATYEFVLRNGTLVLDDRTRPGEEDADENTTADGNTTDGNETTDGNATDGNTTDDGNATETDADEDGGGDDEDDETTAAVGTPGVGDAAGERDQAVALGTFAP